MNENSVIAAVFIALGISVPGPALAGGMLLALGCAYAVRAFRKEGQRGLVLTLFAACIVSLLTAIAHPNTVGLWLWGGLPLQLQMATAGALSQTFFEIVAARAPGLLNALADKLPGGNAGDNR